MNLDFYKKDKNYLIKSVKVVLIIVNLGRQKLTITTPRCLGVELPLQRVKIKTNFYQNKKL